MKILFVSAILLSIIIVTPGCSTIKSARIYAPSLFGTTEIQEGIFLDKEATENQKKDLLESITTAKTRLVRIYGTLKTKPKIVACGTEACYKKFGGISSIGKNYGNVAILLSPRGINPEVISHEWSHRELFERLGFIKIKKIWRIAYWFDEGLAVYISEDERFLHDKWKKETKNGQASPGLDDIDTLKKWLKVNREKDHIMSHGTAREEIARWYAKVGEEGLMVLIDRLSKGEDFYSAYFDIADIHSTFLTRKTYQTDALE